VWFKEPILLGNYKDLKLILKNAVGFLGTHVVYNGWEYLNIPYSKWLFLFKNKMKTNELI
jgi:hypothetical protein